VVSNYEYNLVLQQQQVQCNTARFWLQIDTICTCTLGNLLNFGHKLVFRTNTFTPKTAVDTSDHTANCGFRQFWQYIGYWVCVNERTNEVCLPKNKRVYNGRLPVEAEAHQSWPPMYSVVVTTCASFTLCMSKTSNVESSLHSPCRKSPSIAF